MNQNVFLKVKAAVKTESYEKIIVNELADAVATMRETKHFLNPLTKEKHLINKWLAVVYVSKHKRTLYISKFIKRFLVDECLMRCLKPKIDSGTLLEDAPKHLPPDDQMFRSYQSMTFRSCTKRVKSFPGSRLWKYSLFFIYIKNSGFSIKRKKITFKEH